LIIIIIIGCNIVRRWVMNESRFSTHSSEKHLTDRLHTGSLLCHGHEICNDNVSSTWQCHTLQWNCSL